MMVKVFKPFPETGINKDQFKQRYDLKGKESKSFSDMQFANMDEDGNGTVSKAEYDSAFAGSAAEEQYFYDSGQQDAANNRAESGGRVWNKSAPPLGAKEADSHQSFAEGGCYSEECQDFKLPKLPGSFNKEDINLGKARGDALKHFGIGLGQAQPDFRQHSLQA